MAGVRHRRLLSLVAEGTVKPEKPEAVLASQKEMRADSFLAVIVFSSIMDVYCWDWNWRMAVAGCWNV